MINKKQKSIIVVGAILVILMGIFPPWSYTMHGRGVNSVKPAGYALIIDPPTPERRHPAAGVEVDITILLIQWSIVIAAMVIGIFLTSKSVENSND